MPKQPPPRPRPTAGSQLPAELLELTDACAHVLASQQRLARQLHAAGLITDRAATALLARVDQLDAAITDLRTRHRDPARRRT